MHIFWSMVIPENAAPVTGSCLEDKWPCVDGLSPVNATGLQSRDLIDIVSCVGQTIGLLGHVTSTVVQWFGQRTDINSGLT